jgi:predicted glycosyltransferase
MAAWLVGVPVIYVNDNEHALGNWLAVIFANVVFVPECLEEYVKRAHWERFTKVRFYPGIKEAIYLSRTLLADGHRFGETRGDTIFFRPEPWLAQYYTPGTMDGINLLLQELSRRFRVVVLPRGSEQATHFRKLESETLEVQQGSLPLAEIARRCRLFIGAGGTMSRELAVLGVPTLSIYQNEQLAVDRLLIAAGLMHFDRNPTAMLVRTLLENPVDTTAVRSLVDNGNSAYEAIKSTLIELGEGSLY